MMKRLADLTMHHGRLVIASFVLLAAVFSYGLTRLELDDSLDVMQPENSPSAQLDEQIEATFGAPPSLAIALAEGEIYTPRSLETLRLLTEELRSIDGVLEVTSVANGSKMIDDDGFLLIEDLLPEARLCTFRRRSRACPTCYRIAAWEF